MHSTPALSKRQCSKSLAKKLELACSCQVAEERSADPLLGLASRGGHGALAASWIPAALHVHHTPNELLDCTLAHMQHSVSPAITGNIKVTRCHFQRSSLNRGQKTRGKGHCLSSIVFKACGSVDQAILMLAAGDARHRKNGTSCTAEVLIV